MSTNTVSVAAPPNISPSSATVTAHDSVEHRIECTKQPAPAFLHSPPDSNNAAKSDATDSELSDLDEEPVLDEVPVLPPQLPESESNDAQHLEQPKSEGEDDIGEILPDHWSGAVAIFKPTMAQFKDFNRFMDKVDRYGMKSGIIKIIPPEEWKSAQPKLDDLVKQIKVREPIKQDIMGSNGTYRQVNILHGRSYNVPQWRQLCDQSEHQPPARRGERRANVDKPRATRTRSAASKPADPPTPKKRGRGRPNRGRGRKQNQKDENERPMTPVSPKPDSLDTKEEAIGSIEQDQAMDADDEPRPVGRMGGIRPEKSKTQSTSARRKYSRREGSVAIDEAAFKDFDYLMDVSEYTPERCEELERAYWKTLTYASPLYGADMMGTLFDDRTETWNLNKLPNVLDVLGSKIPGVNTAYLYLGMWKATFAWHLEDVDLYSINYLHFGAPKQWYSISQADARRFEAAMKSVWPADAKACSQFLRHKAFLISPQHLLQHYGIKVNKVVSYPGEFVVTYPYGYHSGYNLGYNCAEAVNFGLESWLEMGKIAKKCECAQAQDSVWINVHEIERKLRGEETEYEETEEDEDEEEDDDDDMSGLPTPPAGHGVRFKDANRKRRRGLAEKGGRVKVKRIKLRLKTKTEPPCCLCPNDIAGLEVLPTDDGRKAHKLCALYIPETYIDTEGGKEVISNISTIQKDRLDLKCLFCRSKRGACFQCCHQKCARAYHATCAAAAGVFVEDQDIPVFGEDGKEYKEQAFEFSCRFHRTRREKKVVGEALEADVRIQTAAAALKTGEICQLQFLKGDIFAGMVVENRPDEGMLLIDILPSGDRMEVDWKWLLLPDPSDYHLPKASANALPMPTSRKAKDKLNTKRHHVDKPRKDDPFVDGFTWAEFNSCETITTGQVKIDFGKQDQIWHYLGKTSTDAKAQYTEDPAQPRHNLKGNYLDTIPKPPKPPKPIPAARPTQQRPSYTMVNNYSHPYANAGTATASSYALGAVKPYVYKPRIPIEQQFNTQRMYTPQNFGPRVPLANAYASSFHSNSKSQIPKHQSNNNLLAHPTASVQQPGWSNGTPPAQKLSAGYHIHPPPAPLQLTNHNKPSWQVYSSVYQKYSFFQVHHNRESSKYRTPYAPWGGFTNGYEGDLKAHLMAKHNSLLATFPSNPVLPRSSSMIAVPPPLSPTTPQEPTVGATSRLNTTMSPPPGPAASNHQYPSESRSPNTLQGQQSSYPAGKQRPNLAPKAAFKVGLSAAVSLSLKSTKPAVQIPPKQSPVPLPANFLAAMTSSPNTPASSAKPPPLHPPVKPTTPTTRETPAPIPASPQTAKISTPESSSNTEQPTRPRMTPVPIPNLPGFLPVQVASPQVMRPGASLLTNQSDGSCIKGNDSTPTKSQQVNDPSFLASAGPGHSMGTLAEATQNIAYEKETDSQARVAGQLSEPAEQRQTQEFPDVPGSESMEFVERMMINLRRASLHETSG